MASKQYDRLIKLLLIGDSSVGKSSVLVRFSDDSFSSHFISTIGIDFKTRTMELDGKKIKLQIWDTAGQERFRVITTAYYRGAMGILIIYDVTNIESFYNVKEWIKLIATHGTTSVNKILVGNKCDLFEQRIVTTEMGQKLADEYNLPFIEVSAKTGQNIEETFISLSKAILERLNQHNIQEENMQTINITAEHKEIHCCK